MSSQADHTILELELDQIVIDETIQPRLSGLDEAYLADLQEAPERWPAPVVVKRNDAYALVDGFHRFEAARRLGLTSRPCEVHPIPEDGDLQALAFALNAVHGKPLTLADRREEAERLLRRSSELSDRAIADRCGLSDKTVKKLRAELEATADIPRLEHRVGKDGKARPAKAKRPRTGKSAVHRPTVNLLELDGSSTPRAEPPAEGGLATLRSILKQMRSYVEDYASDGLVEAMLMVVHDQYQRPEDRQKIQDVVRRFGIACDDVAARLMAEELEPTPSSAAVEEAVA